MYKQLSWINRTYFDLKLSIPLGTYRAVFPVKLEVGRQMLQGLHRESKLFTFYFRGVTIPEKCDSDSRGIPAGLRSWNP